MGRGEAAVEGARGVVHVPSGDQLEAVGVGAGGGVDGVLSLPWS